jgi:hypothetical protein
MNLLSSEEATNFKERSIALASAPKIELADGKEAKDALDNPISNYSIPYTDFKPFIMKYILKRWQDNWDQQFL